MAAPVPFVQKTGLSSLALLRHLERLVPLFAMTSLPTSLPRVSSCALQHLPDLRTRLFSVERSFAHPFNPSRFQGLVTLLTLSVLTSSKASFSSQRSWASLFRAFFLSRGQRILSNPSLHSCRYKENFSAFSTGFSGFLPPEKLCPPLAPRWFRSGQGLWLS